MLITATHQKGEERGRARRAGRSLGGAASLAGLERTPKMLEKMT